MYETTEHLGPWLVTAQWDDQVSRTAPVRLVIEPVGTAGPAELAGGISTTVLRKVRLERGQGVSVRKTGQSAELLRRAVKEHGPSDDGYLAALAQVYVDLTSEGRRAIAKEIRGITGQAESTIKAQLGEARRRGLLSPAVPNRPGGQLTEEARSILARKPETPGS